MIKFLLDRVPHQVEHLDPNTMLLDYLRVSLGRNGTKEGCASGDCGACTVVTVELVEGELQYLAVNACITPLGSVHGKQLLTVEDLAEEGALHPVQRAMVDCHGSQCGFCTPGFVMSMFAHRHNYAAPERERLLESLGGNLCRCTGYRPIVEAGVQMYEPPGADRFTLGGSDTVQALQGLTASTTMATLDTDDQRYLAPISLTQLAEVLHQYPDARMVAGGTDLCLEITQDLASFDTLVDTTRVAELNVLAEGAETIEIGAAVTYSRSAPLLTKHYPALAELIERLGSKQIRNRGTVGGNIANASPIGDMPPVLIALGAELQLYRAGQSRRILLQDYFVSYRQTQLQAGEFIEKIIVPVPTEAEYFYAYKVSKRLEDDISALCMGLKFRLEEGCVAEVVLAFGGMAEIPKRALACEAALLGQPWTEQCIAHAADALAQDYQAIDDFRASAVYRLQVAKNLLRRAYLESQDGSALLRVTQYA